MAGTNRRSDLATPDSQQVCLCASVWRLRCFLRSITYIGMSYSSFGIPVGDFHNMKSMC